MSRTKAAEKITKHILFSVTFFRSCAVYEIMCRAGEATDDNMVHVHFTVGIKVLYTDTHSEYTIRITFPL